MLIPYLTANKNPPPPPPPAPKFAILPKIINGGIAGVIGVTCVFPLDLVKTRLQNQTIGPNGEKIYSSIVDCFRKTIQSEGYFGMYRGSAVNILLVTPEKAIKLSANDLFRYQFTMDNGKLPLSRQMAAGALAGFFPTVVTTPMELLKIRMQTAGRAAIEAEKSGQSVPKVTASMIAKSLIQEKGIMGLYKGIVPTIVRDFFFSIIYFPMFATLNQLGPRKSPTSDEAVFFVSFLSGLGAGSTAALLACPMDVVKTRLQAATKGDGLSYSGMLDCYYKTFKNDGPTAFFRGGLCRMIVIAPLFAIAQMMYFIGVGEMLLGILKP